MCLGIPGLIVEIVDEERGIVKADVGGVRRNINVEVLPLDERPVVGDWVLIHVGFAMAKIDEDEAQETFRFLEGLGAAYSDELDVLLESRID